MESAKAVRARPYWLKCLILIEMILEVKQHILPIAQIRRMVFYWECLNEKDFLGSQSAYCMAVFTKIK